MVGLMDAKFHSFCKSGPGFVVTLLSVAFEMEEEPVHLIANRIVVRWLSPSTYMSEIDITPYLGY